MLGLLTVVVETFRSKQSIKCRPRVAVAQRHFLLIPTTVPCRDDLTTEDFEMDRDRDLD